MHSHIREPIANSIYAFALLIIVTAFMQPLAAQQLQYRSDEILVKPRAKTTDLATKHAQIGAHIRKSFPRFGNLQLIKIPRGANIQEIIAEYQSSGLVEYAEPNYVGIRCSVTPNDPKYLDSTLWNLNNTSQDADIDAPEAWQFRTDASSVIVAVIDGGVNYRHEDLTGNMWHNPGESGLDAFGHNRATNNIDDDLNGYVDDLYGINPNQIPENPFASGDPDDIEDHGSHIAGTIGAVGNNGKGIVGVAWQVQIMALNSWNELVPTLECLKPVMNIG